MARVLDVDYRTLKDGLLAKWVPVVGVTKTEDLWRKNLNKFLRCVDTFLVIPGVVPHWLDVLTKECERLGNHLDWSTNVECYFDVHQPFQLSEAVLTGSWSEGLFSYARETPDLDFMCILKNIRFSHDDQEDCKLLLREDTPFVYAFLTSKEAKEIWSAFLEADDYQDGKRRLSSKKLKEKLQENYQSLGKLFPFCKVERLEEVTEGAAVTVSKSGPNMSLSCFSLNHFKEHLRRERNKSSQSNEEKGEELCHDYSPYDIIPSCDIVLAISCEGWPSCAREWITRERFWPDQRSVKKITQDGFHIVPKSSPDGDFRLSFSCAETKLVETLSPLQHKVMRAFKEAVQYHQNTWSPKLKEIISSYHLKTIVFWYFEKTAQESWTKETLVHHLVSLLEGLAEALRMQNLPMYFMPKVNLFHDIDDPEIALDLMGRVSLLSQNFSAIYEAISNKNALRTLWAFNKDNPPNLLESFLEEEIYTRQGFLAKKPTTLMELFENISKSM